MDEILFDSALRIIIAAIALNLSELKLFFSPRPTIDIFEIFADPYNSNCFP